MRSLNQHRELRRERLAKGASGHDRWSPRLATTPPLCIKRYPGCAIACSVKGVIRISKEAAMHGNMIVMDVARDQQEHGAIPAGTIASVKHVR